MTDQARLCKVQESVEALIKDISGTTLVETSILIDTLLDLHNLANFENN